MFSLKWFTTIPGLLITGGVLLLLVALIIFIVTSRKEKKNGEVANNNAGGVPNPNGMTNQAVAVQPTIESQPAGVDSVPMQGVPVVQPSATENSPVIAPTVMSVPVSDNFSNSSVSAPADNLLVGQSLNTVSPVGNSVGMPSVEVPSSNTQSVANESIGLFPSAPVVNPAPVTDPTVPEVQPAVIDSSVNNLNQVVMKESVAVPAISEVPEVPAISPDVNVSEVVAPSVEQVVPELQDVSAPTISTTDTYTNPYNSDNLQSVSNNTSIYGGADPVVSDIVVNQGNPQIYGGANPLEGTQSIPVAPSNDEINTQQVYPTIDTTPVVNVNTPVVEQPVVVPTPVDSVSVSSTPANSIPAVEPVVSDYVAQQPVVSNEPVVNQINNNFTYQSSTAPQVQLSTDGNIQ